jgi:hypothetical protein
VDYAKPSEPFSMHVNCVRIAQDDCFEAVLVIGDGDFYHVGRRSSVQNGGNLAVVRDVF